MPNTTVGTTIGRSIATETALRGPAFMLARAKAAEPPTTTARTMTQADILRLNQVASTQPGFALRVYEAGNADASDIDTLLDACDNIFGRSFCALADGAVSPITSSIQYFREEYLAHLEHGGCPFDRTASSIFQPAEATA